MTVREADLVHDYSQAMARFRQVTRVSGVGLKIYRVPPFDLELIIDNFHSLESYLGLLNKLHPLLQLIADQRQAVYERFHTVDEDEGHYQARRIFQLFATEAKEIKAFYQLEVDRLFNELYDLTPSKRDKKPNKSSKPSQAQTPKLKSKTFTPSKPKPKMAARPHYQPRVMEIPDLPVDYGTEMLMEVLISQLRDRTALDHFVRTKHFAPVRELVFHDPFAMIGIAGCMAMIRPIITGNLDGYQTIAGKGRLELLGNYLLDCARNWRNSLQGFMMILNRLANRGFHWAAIMGKIITDASEATVSRMNIIRLAVEQGQPINPILRGTEVIMKHILIAYLLNHSQFDENGEPLITTDLLQAATVIRDQLDQIEDIYEREPQYIGNIYHRLMTNRGTRDDYQPESLQISGIRSNSDHDILLRYRTNNHFFNICLNADYPDSEGIVNDRSRAKVTKADPHVKPFQYGGLMAYCIDTLGFPSIELSPEAEAYRQTIAGQSIYFHFTLVCNYPKEAYVNFDPDPKAVSKQRELTSRYVGLNYVHWYRERVDWALSKLTIDSELIGQLRAVSETPTNPFDLVWYLVYGKLNNERAKRLLGFLQESIVDP